MTGKERAQICLLRDGRLHLNDGPIDLIVDATGEAGEIGAAYAAAASRFVEILDELCSELPLLRAKAGTGSTMPAGPIARRMTKAVQPFAREVFITPMAAVAGSVAEEILSVMTYSAKLSRISVNNGGDIAIHLSHGQRYRIGIVSGLPDYFDSDSLSGSFDITSEDPSRGIATSGWKGRSFSLGIADAITVLARTAAMADAAATVIANAVDLPGNPAIVSVPACDLAPDSDLGHLLVTRHVGALSRDEISLALSKGSAVARDLHTRKLIDSAALSLQGVICTLQPENSRDWDASSTPVNPRQDREACHA